MLRVLLDTNIYGLISIDIERRKIIDALYHPLAPLVYGMPLIRKELRDTTRTLKMGGINIRNDLLILYDEVTKKHALSIPEEAAALVEKYFAASQGFGNSYGFKELETDFMIVACAALHELDVVISQDKRTMCSDACLKAYALVHSIKGLKNPEFINYDRFKEKLIK
ncbi:hypothetical protein HZB01_05525 [Candidatus Woesearchaeota archaeon]|nr:hypothetical protein [Candidatus Woesearchaeota archaeon]